MRGVPAIAANPREGSTLLWFWVKVPNSNSEIGTTRLARARACGTQVEKERMDADRPGLEDRIERLTESKGYVRMQRIQNLALLGPVGVAALGSTTRTGPIRPRAT
jgi:hypothetical protein